MKQNKNVWDFLDDNLGELLLALIIITALISC